MRRHHRAVAIDWSTLAEGMRGPNTDTRQWVSYGVVQGATEDDPEKEVMFDEEWGQPLVKVVLQPSMLPVVCRVCSQYAGNGEAEYHPFIDGDEVVVALPEGDERAGAVIFGRLNNAIDKFPRESVAGQDPTTNTFAFRRSRTPTIDEYAGPYILRSALSGALLSFDEKGSLTMRDGEGSGFQMSSDMIGMQGPDGDMLLQIDLTGRHVIAQAGDAVLSLSASDANPDASTVTVPGAMTIGTNGNAPGEHAISTEAVVNLMAQVFQAMSAVIALIPGPMAGAALAPVFSLAGSLIAELQAGIGAAATTPINPTLLAAISGAISAQPQKTVILPPNGQPNPGIGCSGTLIG